MFNKKGICKVSPSVLQSVVIVKKYFNLQAEYFSILTDVNNKYNNCKINNNHNNNHSSNINNFNNLNNSNNSSNNKI